MFFSKIECQPLPLAFWETPKASDFAESIFRPVSADLPCVLVTASPKQERSGVNSGEDRRLHAARFIPWASNGTSGAVTQIAKRRR